ncbi:MAG: zinc ribbon domain-containing protein [Anaerolineaceae bacterium]|nr:zinc ribbon domain-containing protein [Anaerolineaceae bacterium]
MPSPEKIREHRKTMTQVFLEQAQPLATGMPHVWAKQFGEAVTSSEQFGAVAKTSLLPFGKSKLRTDFRIYHQLPTRIGDIYGVQHFSAATIQPTDFVFTLQKPVPRAAFLRKAKGKELTDSWATTLTESGEEDAFAEFLTNIERKDGILPDCPHYHASWKYSLGKMSVEVPYTMALIPLGDGRTVFLFKNNYRPGFFSVRQTKFDIEEAVTIAEWINEALGTFGYDGDPAPLEVPVPALSLLAIPEIEVLFDYKGEEVAWDVDLSAFRSIHAAPSAPAPGEPTSPAQSHKFCTKCGKKLAMDAEFCSACGTKQS